MADQGYPRSRAEAAAVFEAVEDSVAALTRSTTCAAWTRDRDDLLLVIEEPEGGAPGDFGALAQEVRAAVSRQHDLVPAEIVFVPARSIPRGGNDEVLRAETAAIHLRGGLDVLHATRQLGVAAPPLLGAEESIVDDEVLRGLADAAESGGEAAPLDLELMRLDVAELLGESAESIADDEDLIMRGLDSIMIMTLVNQWRADGVQVSFPELFQDAVLAKWWESISGTSEPEAGDEAAVDEAVVDEAAPFDLSVMQHAYWVGRGDEQVLGGVGAHFYNEFSGRDVDPPRLERAVRALTERHGMLRARFTDDGRQWIAATCPWPGLSVHDLRQLAADEVDHRLSSLRERLSHRRLEVERGEVFDVQLSLLPGGASRVHVNIDMLVADALSFRILLTDLARCYEEPEAEQPPIGYSYPKYLAQRNRRRTQAAEQARAYWRDRIADLPGGPELPLAIAPERISQRRVTRRYHWLDAQGRDLLAAKARQHGLTMPVVFMTAFAEVLGTWSASKRFLLNLPLFDREAVHPDVFRLSGDFTNLILLEVDLTEPSSFAERARRLRAQLQSDTANAEYSGVAVLRDLARANGGEPVRAPVVFTSGLSLGELFSEEVRRCFGSPTWMISQGPQVWLDHQVTEHDGGLLLNWDAENELFPDGLLDAMFAAYRVVLDWLAAADWAQPVPPLLPAEQAAVRATVNETEGPTSGLLLHEGFFRTAEIAPQRPALLWGEQGVLSYGALADRARRIAGFLLGRGVRPGERVAITLPKGPDQVAAALGVLLAGATYVPVGVDQPVARRAKIYRRAEVRQVLTTAEERTDSTWPADVEPVAVEVATSVDPLTTQVPGDRTDLAAYVIFTSGSTGEPKGVMVSHAAAINTIADLNERFEVGAEDRVLAISALDFDLSVYDIFGLLSAGGALVLVPEAERRNAAHWVELARRWKVTIWQSVPALLDMLLTAAAAADQVLDLRLALLGGDWVTVDLLDRLRACSPKGRLVGLGGTTEAAIHSTICEVEEIPAQWSSVPYGTPLRNVRCRVVDERGQDCPDWGVGELWIGGRGVALGYCGDPDRTAERFVVRDGIRWYRTGDLARYWPDGSLEFLGRADHQVKVRGHRIDLGEVEAALNSHPDVARSVVVVTVAAGTRLVAAVFPGGRVPPLEDLRDWLGTQLPAHMVPADFVVFDELPLNANGKIDRKRLVRLLAPEERTTAELRSPQGPVEELVAQAWSDLLGGEPIGRDDDFFTRGGDSLLATRVVGRLRAAGLRGAELRALFAKPVLRDFATDLEIGASPVASALPADPAHRYEPFPLTDVQQAYLLGRGRDFALGGVASHWYWEFDTADLDLPRLEEAWNRVVARHEMLRVVFEDGRQRILPAVPRYALSVEDARGGAEQVALDRMRAAMSHQVLDVSRWPLFDIRAVRYSGGRVRLGFSLDLLMLDALSIVIVFAELSELYHRPGTRLPEIGVSFRDYVLGACGDREQLAESKRYWAERAPSLPPAPQLPLRTDPELVAQPRFTRRQSRIPRQRWQRIVERARQRGLTPASVLATCFAEVLGRWSRQRELTLNLTLFDRREVHPEINGVVGDFTALLLVGYEPRAGECFAERAARFQRQMWQDLDHRDVSAVQVMRDLAASRGSAAAMPVVFTSALGIGRDVAAERFAEEVWGLSQTPQVWLDHQVRDDEGGMRFNWDAVEELFPEGLLDAMFQAECRLLDWLADADWSQQLPDLLPTSQRAVREQENSTREPTAAATLLHSGFFARADADPARTALVWGADQRCEYGELADLALRVAAHLVERGVRAGDNVAVALPKGRDQIVAVLGVLAAGAVYVPVGVDQPDQRRQRIYSRAGVRVVLDDLAEAYRRKPLAGPVEVDPESLAYVIFTSGSTGEPKGVMVSHASAMNTIADVNARFGVGAEDRVLAISALDFDLSVYDIFGLLSVGGSVVLIDEDGRREAREWAGLCRRWNVTVWNTVPALLDMLLVVADVLPGSFRLALVSGDWVGLDLWDRLRERAPGCALVALGGATEAAIWSNFFEVERVDPRWRSIPYGRPLANQRFRVVDPTGQDCPEWTEGELWIGGRGVAAGYCGDADRTAERFVEWDGIRWYRTGDLGRYWPDGVLEFLGRVDNQVKVRGHRIELGEIEAALTAHPDVGQAVAASVGDRAPALVAVVVPEGDRSCDSDELRSWLLDRLPAYMVPERIAEIAEVPLTANGKLDRASAIRGLADGAREPAETGEPLRGEVEIALAEQWREVLGVPALARDDNFFVLGGDSLLATRVVERIRRLFGVDIALREFLAGPSLQQQGELVKQRSQAGHQMEEGVI